MPRTFFASAHPDCIQTRKAGVKVDRIIIHTMEGTFTGSLSWFQAGKDTPGREVPTAAHYLVSREGDICQMVADERKCFHAGNFNSRSIGIEHEARIDPWPPRRNKDGSLKPPPFPTNDFPLAMLDSSAKITAIMCKKFDFPPDREHIIGHAEVPGASHRDPGLMFPWDSFVALVASHHEALVAP